MHINLYNLIIRLLSIKLNFKHNEKNIYIYICDKLLKLPSTYPIQRKFSFIKVCLLRITDEVGGGDKSLNYDGLYGSMVWYSPPTSPYPKSGENHHVMSSNTKWF